MVPLSYEHLHIDYLPSQTFNPRGISIKKAIAGDDIPGDVFRLLGGGGLRIINHNRLTL
jgi:hypothetical protein